MRADAAARPELREELRALRRAGPVVVREARGAERRRCVVVVERVPDVRVGDRRSPRPAGVPLGRVVGTAARVVAVERLRRRVERPAGDEVPAVVGQIRRQADRPAVVRRLAHDLHPARARRPAEVLRDPRVRRVVGHVRDVVLVEVDPERVPEAHRVDLGPRLLRAVVALVEQVALRDRVAAVGPHLDAQHLAAQVVGVQRRPPRVDERRLQQPAGLRGGGRHRRAGPGEPGRRRRSSAGRRWTSGSRPCGCSRCCR